MRKHLSLDPLTRRCVIEGEGPELDKSFTHIDEHRGGGVGREGLVN